jgi:membrane protease subunit HflC
MKKSLLLLLAAACVVIAWRCLLFVDETQYVIVTQFGRPVATLTEAGLYFKPPYQSALAIDRRMQIYNPRPSEFLTSEKKNVDLDVYVLWSVEDPQRFIETVNDAAGAGSRIHDVVWSKLAAAVSRNSLESLVSVDPKAHALAPLVEQVERECAAEVHAKYGIRIVDVRIKRIGLPDQVRDSVFERMRKERARIAQRYRSEGNEEATKIRAAADKERAVLLASANKNAEIIRGQAEAEATRTYSKAHQKDPQFFELTRTLEAYKKFLDEKTTILLSGDSELLKYISRGPGESAKQQTQNKEQHK